MQFNSYITLSTTEEEVITPVAVIISYLSYCSSYSSKILLSSLDPTIS